MNALSVSEGDSDVERCDHINFDSKISPAQTADVVRAGVK